MQELPIHMHGQSERVCSPYFTKVMKVTIRIPREEAINVAAYIDDLILFGDNAEQLTQDTNTTIHLLQKLGYVINFEKSSITPAQRIEHLGLILDSVKMKAKLTNDKCDNIINICATLRKNTTNTIREVAKAVGTMVSYLPGVEYGIMHYRRIEKCKNEALKRHKGNFQESMTLTSEALQDLLWWEQKVYQQDNS